MSNSILDELDRVVLESFKNQRPEQVLINFYSDLWTSLKRRACTSTNFTGISEYLFYRAIAFKLEKALIEKFEPKQFTKDTYYLESKTIILTRDLDLQKINTILPKMRPDIALFQKGESQARLVAAFELKLYISNRHILSDLLERLKKLTTFPDVLLFPILSQVQYKKEVNRFCNDHPKRSFVITNEEGAFELQVTLLEALQAIIRNLQGNQEVKL